MDEYSDGREIYGTEVRREFAPLVWILFFIIGVFLIYQWLEVEELKENNTKIWNELENMHRSAGTSLPKTLWGARWMEIELVDEGSDSTTHYFLVNPKLKKLVPTSLRIEE